MQSGYAVGGYTRADLDALLEASDKLNEQKQKIGRLLSTLTYLIHETLEFFGGFIHKKVQLVGADDYWLWITADDVGQVLRLEIGKMDFSADEFLPEFKLRAEKRRYLVEEIPLRFVVPLYQTMPQVFTTIQAAHHKFSDLDKRAQWMISCADLEVMPREIPDIFRQPVEEMPLSVRTYNCLKNSNVQTVYVVVTKTEAEFLRTKLFGRKSLHELKEVLASQELHLGMTNEEMLYWTPPDPAKSRFAL